MLSTLWDSSSLSLHSLFFLTRQLGSFSPASFLPHKIARVSLFCLHAANSLSSILSRRAVTIRSLSHVSQFVALNEIFNLFRKLCWITCGWWWSSAWVLWIRIKSSLECCKLESNYANLDALWESCLFQAFHVVIWLFDEVLGKCSLLPQIILLCWINYIAHYLKRI